MNCRVQFAAIHLVIAAFLRLSGNASRTPECLDREFGDVSDFAVVLGGIAVLVFSAVTTSSAASLEPYRELRGRARR